jgi:O-Antigen ligase
VSASAAISTGRKAFAAAWGAFLGLAILKFTTPVATELKLRAPSDAGEWLTEPWPNSLGRTLAIILLVGGGVAAATARRKASLSWRAWAPPAAWLAWQWVSAGTAQNGPLAAAATGHFLIVAAAWIAGWWIIGRDAWRPWLCAGLLAGFAWCTVRAAQQSMFEFRENRRVLIENEQSHWTNQPPEALQKMVVDGTLFVTNGGYSMNPVILYKLDRARAFGTMAGYPNALAGIVLLAGPLALVMAWRARSVLRPVTGAITTVLTIGLTFGALVFSGSKAGWLIAVIAAAVAAGQRLPGSWRRAAAITLVVAGAAVFTVRFRSYLTGGASSAGARLQYWRAAVEETRLSPWTGGGPGCFYPTFEKLKSPDAETARLTHNDYLEQFCDSGIPGGVAYAAWMTVIGAGCVRVWRSRRDPWESAMALGLGAWMAQGFVEFGLYIPALSWVAFTFAGILADEGRPTGAEGNPSATPRLPSTRPA